MAEDRPYISYPFHTPRMDQSVPPNQVKPGTFGRLSGVDGRFNGCLRKYFGNRKVLDLNAVSGMSAIDSFRGPDFIRYVTFQKRTTTDIYRGFVVRWDSQNDTTNEQIDLIYTTNNGSAWSILPIWTAGSGITSVLEVDCCTSEYFLMVAVDTKATQTIYWDGSNLACVDSGPGAFSAALGAPTLSGSSVDASYNLTGDGTYQVAWRFYSSTRGVYSALSDPLTIQLGLFETTQATGSVSFNSVGGSSGLFVDGDQIIVNGRVYEADTNSTITGDVAILITGLSSVGEHAQALADAINGDSLAVVTAQAQSASVLLTAIETGSGGNFYSLAKAEVGGYQNDLIVSGGTLTGGGAYTTNPQPNCKAVIDLPDNDDVVSDKVYKDFDDLFDTVDIFRTINLGSSTSLQGAIFYLEQSITKDGNWDSSATWDALQVTIGAMFDDSLPFQTQYDPEKDIVETPPQSGTIGRYERQTYMAQAESVNGGFDTLFSSAEQLSPEYFSTYNVRKGDPPDGRPLRFFPAGDSMFQLGYNSVVFIYKSGTANPIQFTRLHRGRGITGKEAGHVVGNSVFLITGLGLTILNAMDGSMGGISTADRVLFDDWKDDLADIRSGHDSLLNASFFLNPTREEMLVIWHSTQVVTMLDGTNFVDVTEGPDLSGRNNRAYFITKTGLIVSPDPLEAGSGTMWDLSSSYTLNGTVTSGGVDLVDGNATFHEDMVGTKVYAVTGENAGMGRTVATVNTGTHTLTLSTPFPYDFSVGDTYAVSPVPFSLRAWPLQVEEISRFNRWIVAGVAVKSRRLIGFAGNPNNTWRVGAYRNSADVLESAICSPSVNVDPYVSVGGLNVHGVDLEPYIEQIASGVSFELTDAEFNLTLSDSRRDG